MGKCERRGWKLCPARGVDEQHDFKGASREELLEVIGRLEAVIGGQQAVIDQLQRRIRALEGCLKGKGRLGMPGNKLGARPGPTEQKGPRKPRPHGFARRRMEPTRRVEHALETCPWSAISTPPMIITRA